MKKNILSLAALVWCTSLYAANDTTLWKGFHAGAGLSLTAPFIINQLSYDQPELDYKINLYPAGGIALGYNFDRNECLQVEINFVKQGQCYEETVKDTHYTRQVALHYIHVPLLFKYMHPLKTSQLYVMLGPDIAFLRKYSSILHGGKNVDQAKLYEPKGGPLFTEIDFGINLAFGSEVMIGGNCFLNAGIQMCYGLTDINSPYYREDYKGRTYARSSNFYIGIGMGLHYLFNDAAKKEIMKPKKK